MWNISKEGDCRNVQQLLTFDPIEIETQRLTLKEG
ncbi:hypothetical protein LCGC14_0617570 [marine sediment metagenome]|uniref:Uncharacterized protein n=1 Tax=marine sediment metagenome TaxID=412755 RepID=A0A0F9R5S8_9ZZZZ